LRFYQYIIFMAARGGDGGGGGGGGGDGGESGGFWPHVPAKAGVSDFDFKSYLICQVGLGRTNFDLDRSFKPNF
jgi:hypothetical protein